jgi:hypothetical protein
MGRLCTKMGRNRRRSCSFHNGGVEREPRVHEIKHPYGEQDEWGNSLASLRNNLRLTPLERLRKAEDAAQFAIRFKGAAQRGKQI